MLRVVYDRQMAGMSRSLVPAGGPFIGAIRALRAQRVKVPRSDQTSISVGGPRLPTQALGGNGWVLPRSIGRANRAAAPVTSDVPSTRSPRDRKNVRRRQVIGRSRASDRSPRIAPKRADLPGA